MNRALSIAVLCAWVMIQVPQVICSTGCGQSVSPLLLVAEHACHDQASALHRDHCGHGSERGAPERHPSDPEDEDGEHVVVQIESPASSSERIVEEPGVSHAVLAALELGFGAAPPVERMDCSRSEDPPPRVDPVAASDRLHL